MQCTCTNRGTPVPSDSFQGRKEGRKRGGLSTSWKVKAGKWWGKHRIKGERTKDCTILTLTYTNILSNHSFIHLSPSGRHNVWSERTGALKKLASVWGRKKDLFCEGIGVVEILWEGLWHAWLISSNTNQWTNHNGSHTSWCCFLRLLPCVAGRRRGWKRKQECWQTQHSSHGQHIPWQHWPGKGIFLS